MNFRSILATLLLFLISQPARAAMAPGWWVERDGHEGDVEWQQITYWSGGLQVKGWLFDSPLPGPRPGIVFNHGGVSGVSADMMRRSADLARAGYMVFTPTYRGEGGSEGVVEVARGEVDDVIAAAAILRAHPRVRADRIGLVGSSHGALISVLAAARSNDWNAVAAACGVMDVEAWYRYLVANNFDVSDSLSVAVYGRGPDDRPEAFTLRSAVRVAGQIRAPLLLQQGLVDRIVPPDQVWRMAAALERNGRDRPQVRTYPLLGHAFWFWDRAHHSESEVAQAGESWRDLLDFLNEHLQPAGAGDAVAPPAAPPGGSVIDPAWQKEHDAWRDRRLERLMADDGWLTLAGLFWLSPGLNRIGSAPDNEVRLSEGSAPPRVGSLLLEGDRVTLEVLPGVTVTCDGQPVDRRGLATDASDRPDMLALGDLRFLIIKRSKGYAVRLRDLKAATRREFAGIDSWPLDPDWRFEARVIPYEPPKPIAIPNILGTIDTMLCPCALEFDRDGRRFRVEPVQEDPESAELFLIFKDATSGTESYPPGRFLYTPAPRDGRVVLDFNRAYNPPCAFTPFATCPLPPPQNVLPIAVRAGEKLYRGHE